MAIMGSVVALVTPMKEDGALDLAAFERLIDWHVECGTAAVAVVGTTGESPTVNFEEHNQLIDLAVRCANGRIKVLAGAGANSTQEAVALTQHAAKAGADAALSVVPYYNRPSQQGLMVHFKAIAQSARDLPIFLYNVPGRCACNLVNDTVVELAEIDNIVGIKDATGDVAQAADLLARVPSNFTVLCGEDSASLSLMSMGAVGVISVTANVVPKLMRDFCQAALSADWARARALHNRLLRLHQALFVEVNPVPVKWALYRMQHIQNALRLPLLPLEAECQTLVEEVLGELGCL